MASFDVMLSRVLWDLQYNEASPAATDSFMCNSGVKSSVVMKKIKLITEWKYVRHITNKSRSTEQELIGCGLTFSLFGREQ